MRDICLAWSLAYKHASNQTHTHTNKMNKSELKKRLNISYKEFLAICLLLVWNSPALSRLLGTAFLEIFWHIFFSFGFFILEVNLSSSPFLCFYSFWRQCVCCNWISTFTVGLEHTHRLKQMFTSGILCIVTGTVLFWLLVNLDSLTAPCFCYISCICGCVFECVYMYVCTCVFECVYVCLCVV